MQIADRVIEKAELLGTLPASVGDRLPIGEDVARQRQQHRQYVLGNGMRGVATDVRDDDAAHAAGLEVDVVGAGRGDRDHLQGGQRGDQFGVDLQFVDDGYRRSGEALLDLALQGFRMFGPMVLKIRSANCGDDRVALEIDDSVHGSAQSTQGLP